ncbi:MAG: diaminopimelate epimerase [Rhizobiales bacterium]|nr:diaminopimelate epimerase [Hyphomicrobiales bacterium]NRB14573.1 diaminopimelate epimerase [Hyphomicrobiales bacterium]
MQKDIPFLKMNGLGNEFVVLDARKHDFSLSVATLQAIANKQTGIGYDQLIVLENSQIADVFMRIYNADGSQVNACGNATRCVGALIMQNLGQDECSIETNDGKKFARFEAELCSQNTNMAEQRIVTANIGQAKLNWDQIPLSEEFHDTAGIELEVGPLGNPILHTPSVMNMGNPHVVFWADKHPDEYGLEKFGPMIENHPLFPEKANVSVAQVLPNDQVILRTWERGVGITQACGTAACAAAVSAHRRGFTGNKVAILVPAGQINIEWTANNNVLMSGDWMLDYESSLAAEIFLLKDTVFAPQEASK